MPMLSGCWEVLSGLGLQGYCCESFAAMSWRVALVVRGRGGGAVVCRRSSCVLEETCHPVRLGQVGFLLVRL
eukprot:3014360-Prorocentrum_lima.AAC.1